MSLQDFIDGFMHTFQQAQDAVTGGIDRVQDAVVTQFYQMKRSLFRSVIELLLVGISIIFIMIGAVLFLDRYFSLDLVMLVAGLVILNVTLLMGRFR